MEDRMLLSAPTLTAISDVTVNHSSPLIIGLNGADADDDNLTWTVDVTGSGAANLTAVILGDNDGVNYNRSLVIETNLGTMVFELFEDLVPDATDRIIEMVTAGHYDGLTFHRVIDDFVIQTGSYEYDSGYTATSHSYTSFDDQFNTNLQHNSTGLLSWAKRTPDDSASTDFFITDLNSSNQNSVNNLRNLDYNYSVFGKIVEGADVLEAITQVSTGTHNGLSDAPDTAVTITDARIETNEQNATLVLKVGDSYSAGEEVTVTVTADDGNGGTAVRTFTVELQTDNDDVNAQINQSVSSGQIVTSFAENVNNSDPYIATMSPVIVPFGTNTYAVSGVSYDVDGYKDVDFTEYLTVDGDPQLSTATEQVAIAILDGDVLSTSTSSSSYWGNYLDLTKYDIADLDELPSGLEFTNDLISQPRISGSYNPDTGTLTFSVGMTRTDASLVGVYYFFLARYNVVGSPVTSNAYYSTGFDTQVVTMILQPPTPTSITVNDLNADHTDDSTPSITVEGLTVGATLKIYDENDNVVGTTTVTDATTTLSINTLGDGQHTLRATQTVNDAESEAATTSQFTVDTEAPHAFTDVALTAATSGTVYTYDVGHPQEDDSSITFHLSGQPAGMTIDSDTAVISWTTPSDSNYPSVTFDIIARDTAGNETIETVTVTVNSFVDVSGVVYLDANDNQTADSGEGQGGVVVYADLNGNNILDETDIATTTSTTGSVGSYTLENVPAGTVILHQVMTDGIQQISPTDTLLTQVQVIKDGDATSLADPLDTIDGLTFAGALAMSSDGLHVYATSGTGSTTSDDGIAVFERNPNDGTLTYIQFIDGIAALDDPNALVITPDGRHVYVTADNAGSDGIIIFARDADTGLLTLVGSIVDGGNDALGDPVNSIGGTIGITVSADNEFVYVASRFDDAITVFSRNRNTGELTLIQELIDTDKLNGVRHFAISPDGTSLYAAGFEGLVVYSVDTVTGLLTHQQNVAEDSLSDMREMAITPDGKYLYAASDDDGALNIFQRNTTTGQLTLQSTITAQGKPSGVVINGDGTKLYVTSSFVDQLHVYNIATDGSLSLSWSLTHNTDDLLDQTLTGLDGPVTLLLDPDGHDVYVASRSSNSLSVYSDRTRSFSGAAQLLQVTPSTDNTGKNFLNAPRTNDVDSIAYNTLQYDADRPANQSTNAPFDWATQRSVISDITVTFDYDLLDVDKSAVSLVRIFEVDGNAITETVTLNLSDVLVDGDQLILRNLDLVDGVYEITIATDFNAAMDTEYSTHFHQLLGDLNGDRVFNMADLSAMLYWRQLSADTNDHVYVPGYLDIRDTADTSTADGRVDSHDFAAFTGSFGSFIPQAAVPIPVIILASNEPEQPPANLLSFVSNPPQTASLKVVLSIDEEADSNTTILDQLDDPNLVLELLETE
tara:strand:+ start:3929 stop:8158 length:4230 start_codon:yes stop_codon:yes gene_type:complete